LRRFQLGEEAREIYCFFSSQSFWKRGSERKGSDSGSSASGFCGLEEKSAAFLRGDLVCKI
jgi:hypothetical protein